MTCHRCHKSTNCTTMSFFNTDTICMECDDREREHPAFAAAHEAESQAVRSGNYNFPGVGCPIDLYKPKEGTP